MSEVNDDDATFSAPPTEVTPIHDICQITTGGEKMYLHARYIKPLCLTYCSLGAFLTDTFQEQALIRAEGSLQE